jgi:bifunctional non-homologous end joining protein LigD
MCVRRHFPLIVAAALKLRQKHFVIDGEAVVVRPDGISDFDALASRRHDKRAQFYAFDMLAGDGEDYRPQALSLRKGQPHATAQAPRRRHLHCRI